VHTTLALADQTGPIVVTVAYLGLWYVLLFGLQSRTKYRLVAEYEARGETFDRYFGQDERMLAADRAVANTHEQMVPFLVTLWLHAVFLSPLRATVLGGVYVLLRALYPVLLGRSLSKRQPKRVFAVTGPCYLIIAWLGGQVLVAAFSI
jgi:hypothetical protein